MALVYGIRERTEHFNKLKDGTWIFHYELGEGPPLVILHPFGASSWSWREVVPDLAQHFKCYVVDLPGYDRSSIPNRRYAIGDFTSAIMELMDQVGLTHANFLGSATGSIISVDMAGGHPERVDKVALVSCPGWTPEEGARVFWNWFVPRQPNGITSARPFDGGRSKEVWAYAARMRTRDGAWDAMGHEENTSFNVPARAATIEAPTLLVYGEFDTQRRREAKMLETIKNSRAIHISGGTQGVPNEFPDGLAEAVLPFFLEK
jgi:pimeloyl-ACP methyl ester carboxylesterase